MHCSVKFIKNEIIWQAADDFRNSAELSGHNMPPIDMLFVMDVLLEFDVIDSPNLFADLRMDAAIAPTERVIFIDRESLERWERQDQWLEKRLRFSVAHELGHFVLHKDLMTSIRFSTMDQFKQWIIEHRRSKRIEDQADEFAGRFLVPLAILREEYDRFCHKLSSADPAWHEIEGMRSHFAKTLAPRFGVNPQVIETRFDHEDIWPLE